MSEQAHHHGHDQGAGGGRWTMAAHATLHCLTGCVIGEVAGLAIGVTFGLATWATIGLATGLAYLSGFTLGLVPVMRGKNVGFLAALRMIWFGEVISIGVMEIAMNTADYAVGGMDADHIFTWQFWFGIAVAIPAGFLAAWPVNAWLLARGDKHCH